MSDTCLIYRFEGKNTKLNMVDGAEQVLGALNTNDKDLLCEYFYRHFKCRISSKSH